MEGKPRYGARAKKKKPKSSQTYYKAQKRQVHERCGICMNDIKECKDEAKEQRHRDPKLKVQLVTFPSCQCKALMCQKCLKDVIIQNKPCCPTCRGPLKCATCDKVINKGHDFYPAFKFKGKIQYYTCSDKCAKELADRKN